MDNIKIEKLTQNYFSDFVDICTKYYIEEIKVFLIKDDIKMHL